MHISTIVMFNTVNKSLKVHENIFIESNFCFCHFSKKRQDRNPFDLTKKKKVRERCH